MNFRRANFVMPAVKTRDARQNRGFHLPQGRRILRIGSIARVISAVRPAACRLRSHRKFEALFQVSAATRLENLSWWADPGTLPQVERVHPSPGSGFVL